MRCGGRQGARRGRDFRRKLTRCDFFETPNATRLGAPRKAMAASELTAVGGNGSARAAKYVDEYVHKEGATLSRRDSIACAIDVRTAPRLIECMSEAEGVSAVAFLKAEYIEYAGRQWRAAHKDAPVQERTEDSAKEQAEMRDLFGLDMYDDDDLDEVEPDYGEEFECIYPRFVRMARDIKWKVIFVR